MATDKATLEEKRSRYARLCAAEILLSWLRHGEILESPTEDDLNLRATRELAEELYGGGDIPDGDPGAIESEAILAAAFARMATFDAREFFLARSAHFAQLAAKNAARLPEERDDA